MLTITTVLISLGAWAVYFRKKGWSFWYVLLDTILIVIILQLLIILFVMWS